MYWIDGINEFSSSKRADKWVIAKRFDNRKLQPDRKGDKIRFTYFKPIIMKTIEKIIEVPLSEIQTERGKDMDITTLDVCCICGKKIKGKHRVVHLLQNGNIISSSESYDNSQGFFPVGIECVKKLIIKFSF